MVDGGWEWVGGSEWVGGWEWVGGSEWVGEEGGEETGSAVRRAGDSISKREEGREERNCDILSAFFVPFPRSFSVKKNACFFLCASVSAHFFSNRCSMLASPRSSFALPTARNQFGTRFPFLRRVRAELDEAPAANGLPGRHAAEGSSCRRLSLTSVQRGIRRRESTHHKHECTRSHGEPCASLFVRLALHVSLLFRSLLFFLPRACGSRVALTRCEVY